MRKLKRKLFSLKEGSQFEDIAIIVHLWELISGRVGAEIRTEIEGLLPCLWKEFVGVENQVPMTLIQDFEGLITETDECVKEVWASILPQQENLGKFMIIHSYSYLFLDIIFYTYFSIFIFILHVNLYFINNEVFD